MRDADVLAEIKKNNIKYFIENVLPKDYTFVAGMKNR